MNSARRDKVFDCIERGVCFYCDKPIVDGDARYTVLHAHYDCYEKSEDFTLRDPFDIRTAKDLHASLEKIEGLIDALEKRIKNGR